MFIKEQLNDDPLANTEAINAAWRAAGMSGSISSSLVSNVRARLKLAGKQPRKGGRPRKAAVAAGPVVAGADGKGPVASRGRERELMSLEVEIDRVLMKVAQTGKFPEVEVALRKVRRELYAGLVARP
jgi:hypothetical protein